MLSSARPYAERIERGNSRKSSLGWLGGLGTPARASPLKRQIDVVPPARLAPGTQRVSRDGVRGALLLRPDESIKVRYRVFSVGGNLPVGRTGPWNAQVV